MDSKSQKAITKGKQEKEDNNNKEETKIPREILISLSHLDNNKLLDEFNENNYQNRKYNSLNIDNGRLFYKLRYLKKKINENKNKNSSNIKKNNKFLKKLKEEEIQKLLKYEKLNLNYEKTKVKIFIKYSYYFLILIEKSIILFNLKKYKESYDLLVNYGIIQNPFEFGEILLTISGYDKALIGEFISKKTEPNENLGVLKGFINSFEMNKSENIIKLYEYINSKVIMPSEPNQKGIIVNEISLCYFENNKNKAIFKDQYKKEYQSAGMFLNTILNIIISLKEENEIELQKQIQNIMEKLIEEKEIPKIYESIKTLDLTIDKDYIYELYMRFMVLLEEKENIFSNESESKLTNFPQVKYYEYLEEKELSQEESKNNKNVLQNYIVTNNRSFKQNDQEVLTTPITFNRVNGSNLSNLKEYMVIDNFSKIVFEKKLGDVSELKHFILIDDIIDIYIGTGHGENFKKYLKAFPKEEDNQNNFITIICNKDQIDLKSTNTIKGLKWYKSLKTLLYNSKKKNKNKNKENNKMEENKIRDEISSIWNNYIFGKWEIYGNYFLFKCLDHSNCLNDLLFEGKIQTSTIKTDFYEDKKMPLLKIINNFIKEVKDKLSKKDERTLEYNEFLNLCQIGLPNNYRKQIWPLIIGNKCGITTSFYESLKSMISPINKFDDLESNYIKNSNNNFTENYIANEIIKDIIKIKYLFLDGDAEFKKDPNSIMSKVYSICICFYLYRFDISYNKNIIFIIYMLLLKNISENNAFILINNVICSNSLITKLYLWEQRDITIIGTFFEEIFYEYLPRLNKHFKKLGITCDLYLYDWFEGLFIQSVNLKISSIIFELFLIYGEYILIQTSITILKLLEEDLLNLTIDETFKALKRIPLKLNASTFLETFRNYTSIKEKYISNKYKNEYAVQSSTLLEALI